MDLINPSQRRMRRSERITGKYQQAIQAATAAVQVPAAGYEALSRVIVQVAKY
ncbi:hypothetical protein IPA22_005084 [Escherichia coli]|uniref:hypothetical protein n=1 Tax=Escherichia coli TaxID=562 RepID=UPI0015E77448|nr:hypothetical protein [Escherichia coli]EFA4229199.1 hypothetical protein [Escherichia coli O11:H15]EGK4049406.1 hypothetical protein [Escherichia coli]EGK4058810.1 hypothetical protein [Escherichia coli]EII3576225.1 hypothetical protein [Escherichia coli]HCD8865775.1 hypothetical protein [Escherichia coli]